MKRRIIVAGVLGAAAMVGGALFPLVMILFAPGMADGVGEPILAAPNTIVVASVLMVLPGAIGLYLAHADTFDRPSRLTAGAFVAGLVFVAVATIADSVLGSAPGGETGWLAITGVLLVGSVGTGIATASGNTLSHARVGGALLALSVIALVGVVPALSALSIPVSDGLAVVLATGPTGLAWLLLGYDMLTLEDLSIQPTRILPAED